MKSYLDQAYQLKDTLVKHRRYLHRHAEIGFDIPETYAYIFQTLENLGYQVQRVGRCGISCTIGEKQGKVLLVRADMDALPMKEESGLEFASIYEGQAHCCGHDLHSAMLLGVAEILKANETQLKGTVKLMFQPAEEIGQGCRDMIENGLLQHPTPDAVLALHVNALSPLGYINYGKGHTFASFDNFDITIRGKSCHAARAYEGIDPIQVSYTLYSLLQTMKTRCVSPLDPVMLSVTSIQSGNSYNVIPEECFMKGTLRTYDETIRKQLLMELEKLCQQVAQTTGSTIELTVSKGMKPLKCSADFTEELLSLIKEVIATDRIALTPEIKMGSDDFSEVTKYYPETSAYLFIGAGIDERTPYFVGQHNTKVVFNEEVLPIGCGMLTHAIVGWLKQQSI